MQEVTVELKSSFSYAPNGKGEPEDASFITLFPPTIKQIDNFAPIKQAFLKACTSSTAGSNASAEEIAEAKDAKDDDATISPSNVMATLYSSDCKMPSVLLHAKELFKSGAALVEGETKLTIPLMEKMSVTDFENCVGSYIANFIWPSLMDGQ